DRSRRSLGPLVPDSNRAFTSPHPRVRLWESAYPRSSTMRTLARSALGLGSVVALALTLSPVGPADAAPPDDHQHGIQLEYLDRGLVALATDEGVFLSWRLL